MEVEEVIEVYVCPACGNYYGASGMGNLAEMANIAPVGHKQAGGIVSYRDQCPHCDAPKVRRQRRYARLVPDEEVGEIRKQVIRERRTGPFDAVIGLTRG
jgi:hypothetical protein